MRLFFAVSIYMYYLFHLFSLRARGNLCVLYFNFQRLISEIQHLNAVRAERTHSNNMLPTSLFGNIYEVGGGLKIQVK